MTNHTVGEYRFSRCSGDPDDPRDLKVLDLHARLREARGALSVVEADRERASLWSHINALEVLLFGRLPDKYLEDRDESLMAHEAVADLRQVERDRF